MEKLKNLVNPGSKKDDEVMYGSGRSDDPVHTGHTSMGNTNTGSGQGSHFGNSRTGELDTLSTSSNSTGFPQNDKDTTIGTSQYDNATAGRASHGLSEPYASRMPGGFDNDDAATTASVSSGIPGQSQSRSAMTGTNDPNFTEKPLPHEPASGTGIGHGQNSLTGNSYPDRSVENQSRYGDQTGSSHHGRDASLGAGAVGTHAHRHEDSQQDKYAPKADRSFPLGGSSASGAYGSTTAGPHSSNLANKADPRVDSDGSHNVGNTDHGSTSGGIGSARAAGPHSSNLANESDNSGAAGSTGYGSTSGGYRSTTGAAASDGSQRSLGRDALGAGASGMTSGTGYGPESWQHEHQRHGHQYEGDPCQTGAVGGEGGHHFVPGPHATDTANRLDPHVGSGFGGAGLTSGSSEHHHHGHHDHRGEEAALAGGAGTTGLGALKADHRKQGITETTTSSGLDRSNADRHSLDTSGGAAYDQNPNAATGISSTSKTAGPHKSDMLNKLDPHVDSDLSEQQAPHGSDHHYGRDAALAGAGGAGLYEAENHYRGNQSNLTKSSSTSGMSGASPYGSGVDPRMETKREAGSGQQPATISDHHKRDAGFVGAGGTGAYEAQKHLRSSGHSDAAATPQDRFAGAGHQPAIATGPSPNKYSSYSHVGQPQTIQHDSLPAGVAEAGATGRGEHSPKTRDYGRTDPETQVREHQHSGASTATYPSPNQGNNSDKAHHTDHHTGRDATIVGGAGAGAGAGALAGHENFQKDRASHGSEPYQNASREHHTGRDAAILGGATGVGGLAEHEYSKKEAAKTQKEHVKEEKALEKEHSKEVKHHNKELAKEEKAHEKAIDKSEKEHKKAMEKDEKKHNKVVEKDDTKQEHGGKKHGGLLGFLHRDKPDKELKEEEAHRQAATHPGRGENETAAGVGATGLESRSGYDPLEGEHGSQSGVHDSPIGIGSGPTTHDAYGTHDSGHNKLHKDPPAKVLESRGYEFQ